MILAETNEQNQLQGQDVNEKVFNLLEATKTNWSVSKKELQSMDGLKTESFGIFRNDTNAWLGTRTDDYQPMQNATLAQTIIEASNDIGEKFRGGILQGGKKVFYQIALPDHKIETDTIKRWITTVNSHDGSSAIGFGSSNTVVICQNTFYRAYKEIEKFRHSLTANDRLQIAKKKLQEVLMSDQSLMTDYEKMTEHKIDKPIFERVLKNLFDVTDVNTNAADVSTRKKNSLQTFNTVLESELASHGETLWGLFNAVTYYENHIGVKEEKKLERIMIGGAGRTMNLTFNDIMAHIEKHERILVPINQ